MTEIVSFCAPCLRMSCSRKRNVRLCGTFCRTCTSAFQVFFAASFAQSGHWPYCTRYSISNTCSRIVAVRTSFWIVSETRSRFECGSVQMKCASVRRTLLRPLSFLRQMARSSWDSGRAIVQLDGGERNRSQFLQKETDARYSQCKIRRRKTEQQACIRWARELLTGVVCTQRKVPLRTKSSFDYAHFHGEIQPVDGLVLGCLHVLNVLQSTLHTSITPSFSPSLHSHLKASNAISVYISCVKDILAGRLIANPRS